MKETVSAEIDGKTVKIYRAAGDALPVVYTNDYIESGAAVRRRCAELGCPPFHLVTVSGIDWDQDMSPWPSAPVVASDDHFTGGARAYLGWLLEKVVPCAENELGLKNPVSYIAGYSMAGLFALWSLYETAFFSGAVCASGSLWYPGFRDFALRRDFRGTPAGVYLSLGDRESAVENPALQQTEEVFRTLARHLADSGTPSVFEQNPGNHYRDADIRLAKGCRWLLSQGRTGA